MLLHHRFALVFVTLLAMSGLPASAAVIAWSSPLAPEAAGATGSGSVLLSFDTDTHDLTIDLSFSGLSAATTAAHIHCCTAAPRAGTALVVIDSPSLLDFPLGVTSGTYLHIFDLDDPLNFTPDFVTANGGTAAGATARLLAALDGGQAYLNIHTSAFRGGEIRGFPSLVAEPTSAALLVLALAVSLGLRSRVERSPARRR